MIQLTRWGRKEKFHLNPDLIKIVESTPDTVITLINGEKIVVEEKVEEVVKKFYLYKKKIQKGIIRKKWIKQQ